MKRILCIVSSLDAGGAETFLMKVYRSLPTEDYQFDFLVSIGNGCYTEEVLARGGKIYQIPERTQDFFGAFYGIFSVVKNNRYDTVLKLGENALAAADLLAAKLGGAKNLALRSCNAPTGLSFRARSLHSLLRPFLNWITTVKLAPSQLAADFMFGKAADVTLLNNGVDLGIFHYDAQGRSRIRREFDIGDKLVIGHIGRYAEQKNHRYLLEVFQQIRRQREDAVLLSVGTGKMETQIHGWIKELDLEDRVILAGQRFDIPALLSAMDVFVFPSLHEGMPNTVIEAQATGLPCIIADTITREADITGLVQYLSLTQAPGDWANAALAAQVKERSSTKQDFEKHGYDISRVAMELVALICK